MDALNIGSPPNIHFRIAWTIIGDIDKYGGHAQVIVKFYVFSVFPFSPVSYSLCFPKFLKFPAFSLPGKNINQIPYALTTLMNKS